MNSVYCFELETMRIFGPNGIETFKSTVMVDNEDAHIVEGRQWHLGAGYCQSSLPNPNHPNKNRKTYKLHALIMNTPKGLVTHHINHNKLDNRKINLQIMTNTEHLLLHRRLKSLTMQAARAANRQG